jgi:diguanylate cyclase (GGDEF)-like protein
MPLFIPDLTKDVRFRDTAPTAARSVMATPIIRGKTAIGALLVQSSSVEAFSQEDWRLLSLMGDLSGVAIQNALLYQRTQEEAITDGLTGVFVHRYFQERLVEEVKRCKESGNNLTMLMADIDNFKSLNDTYGHLTGDAVLRGVSRTLQEGVRTTDFVARYGGEEFAVLLTETDAAGGLLVAERLRAAVEGCSFAEAGVERKVTVSIGVASYDGGVGEGRNLVERADEALYAAKRAGKNRVIQAPKSA